jgi:hypothetical protein
MISSLCLSMIFSENRFPLCADATLRVRIMLQGPSFRVVHPSRLLPTWKISAANSRKPEFAGLVPRNDECHDRLVTLPMLLSSRPLVAHAQEFHRPVWYRDPEHRADGSLYKVNLAAMGAD